MVVTPHVHEPSVSKSGTKVRVALAVTQADHRTHCRMTENMKQTCINFEEYKPPFDLLTSLANHGGGELLEHVTSFVVPGRTVETWMVFGDESGWKSSMMVARHGKMLELSNSPDASPNVQYPGLDVTHRENAPPLWMSRSTVTFTGVVSAGMLHLTSNPVDIEVIQLTNQDRLSINTFPEVNETWSDTRRLVATYNALLKRDTVFVRKADGSLFISPGGNYGAMDDMKNAVEEGEEDDFTTSADVREMVRKILMPVEDGSILSEASENPFLTLEVVSKSVTLKTRVQTYGKIPVAFRLDSMAMALHAECVNHNKWAVLVPASWTDGKITTSTIDPRNVSRKFNRKFDETASAIVDTMLHSNSALVPYQMPIKKEEQSIFDYTKVRRTPEGCRVKLAPMRKTAFTSAVFARMCMY
jgi:hypothetical protein